MTKKINPYIQDLSPNEKKLEEIYESIRKVRALKTPATWTEAESDLFSHLPEMNQSRD